MAIFNTTTLLMRIQESLDRNDLESAIKVLESLRSADQAQVFDDLDENDQVLLLTNLQPTISADIVEDLDDLDAAELIAKVPQENAVRIIDQMDPDKAADLLGDVTPHHARQLLREMSNPEEVAPLLKYADDSAGGLMTSDYFALYGSMTAAEAIDSIRDRQPELEDVYSLFVEDADGVLVGVISLQTLISARPQTRLDAIMDPDVIHVYPETDQERSAWLMSHYDLVALPVVDHEHKLLGVITVDDVVDVLVDEATEDIQRLGGAQPLAQPYLSSKVSAVAKARIGWLLLLFVTESLTGTVLRHFEHELGTVVALSFFIPLLIGTGGNAGSQATSTIIRGIAVKEIALRDGLKALWHELRVGLMLGAGMALFAYFRALTWKSETALAITVSVAIFAIVIWANALGAILPLLATRLRIDPTVVSGPVMSTLVDATGLFIYFSIAQIMLGI